MSTKSLKELQAAAQKARKALAKYEIAFKEWRATVSPTLSPDEHVAELDAWIKRLGEVRHAQQAAERALIIRGGA